MVEVTEILLRVIRKVIYAIKRKRCYFPPLRLVFFFFFFIAIIALPIAAAFCLVETIAPLGPQLNPPRLFITGIKLLQIQMPKIEQTLILQLHPVCL